MLGQKYKPESLSDLIAGPKIGQFLLSYRWEKPLLIYGGLGVGKTTVSEVLATEKNWQLVRVENDSLNEAILSCQSSNVFGQKKLLLLDDIESMKDVRSIKSLLTQTRNPTIITAREISSPKIRGIIGLCEKLQLRKPLAIQINRLLAEICEKEVVVVESGVLEDISKNCNGNLSSALNDLETLIVGRKTVTARDAEVLGSRDRQSDVYKALSTIFAGKELKEVIECSWDLDERPEDLIQWIAENLPLVYPSEDLASSYDALSKSDVYLGRIRRRQYWGLLRYANALMTGGVNTSKTGKLKFQRYQFPSVFVKMSKAKIEKAMIKGLAEKFIPHLHCSRRVFEKEYLSFFSLLIKNGAINEEDLKVNYRLEDQEIDLLKEKAVL
ncbi:MAG: hypothetical protein ABH950_03630 [Candidatus Altiarchaeota archaeon]